ncbi:MAG: orotate phosphoribosyltransferase [Candidatus Altiarchaeales archaeon HGW-Altiarchaeales-1]|nr:MAG: orotate phosphoribosyltransferase [Candidatus Altiarchaeales archaeon HGW-Altiarchaeales-1]
MDDKKLKLLNLIKKVITYSDIELSSGKKSSFYIDGRILTLSPEGAYLIGEVFFDLLKDKNVDAVGGLELGAVPICGAVAAISYLKGRPIRTFIVRKEPKKHGLRKQIEGPIKKGDKVIIIDDVVTTGGSILKAIECAEKEGLVVVGAVALFDRLEGAKEKFKEKNINFISIFSKDDLNVR